MNAIALTLQPSYNYFVPVSDIDFVLTYGLQIGDRIVRGKSFAAKHHGIYVGLRNGKVMVAENQSGLGVRYVKLSDFLMNDYTNLARIESFPGTEAQRDEVISMVESCVGKTYNFIRFNCEHFAHLVQYGQARSSQAQNVWTVILFIVTSLLTLVF